MAKTKINFIVPNSIKAEHDAYMDLIELTASENEHKIALELRVKQVYALRLIADAIQQLAGAFAAKADAGRE